MPQSYFLFLIRTAMADRLPRTTGKMHPGHPLAVGETAIQNSWARSVF